MPAAPDASAERIKDVNTRYHDLAAGSYDAKWGIDFGEIGAEQVTGKLRKALGEPPPTFGDALEIGAGTGYFSLNLLRAGMITRATATDISPGMLATLRDNAERLGVRIDTVRSDAESLPFAGGSFDLAFGHAVLHHIPDVERAAGELHRVLRPGGAIAFCGEPSRHGDRLAAIPKAVGRLAAPGWRVLVGAERVDGPEDPPREAPELDEWELEREVDVHAFDPGALREILAEAGFGRIRVRGEELLASACGWVLRSLEATADPDQVPLAWQRLAFRSYITLQRLDATLLEPRLPAGAFYNLLVSARKPK